MSRLALFYSIVVICTTVGVIGKMHCLEGDRFLYDGTCAYRHPDPLDWESAVQLCMLLNSQDTLVDVVPKSSMEKFLREENLTSVWIAAHQPVRNRPLKYQLLTREGDFPVQNDRGRKMSAGVEWSSSVPWGFCVLLTVEDVSGVLLDMNFCHRRHSAVCITSVVNETMDEVLLAERKKLLAKMEHPDPEPTLHFRYNNETNQLFLTVDNPERVHRNSTRCYVDRAPLDKNFTVELLPTTVAAEFLVNTKEEGEITCQARVSGSLQLVRTEKFLWRSSEEERMYKLTIWDSATLCDYGVCGPPVDSELLQNLTGKIHNMLVRKMEVDVVHVIHIKQLCPRILIVTYRVHLPRKYVKDLSPTIYEIISRGIGSYFVFVSSGEYCSEETKAGLTWPTTRIGQAANPMGYGRHIDGVRVCRQCGGNFIDGAKWDDPTGWSSGHTCDEPLEREEQIQLLHTRNVSGREKLKMLQTILATQPRDQLNVSEIKGISNVFSNITAEGLRGTDVPTIASITNVLVLLSMNRSASTSLEEVNASNSILVSLDNMLSGVNMTSDRGLYVESEFATFVVDVDRSSSIRGVATNKSVNLGKEDVRTLLTTDDLDDILSSGVVSAVLLPDSLFHNERSRHRVVISIFTSAVLFRANTSSTLSTRHVISVTVDGTRQTLNGSLRLLFKREDPPGLANQCVFWDFQANDNKGMWSTAGCKLVDDSKWPGYDMCECGHLTHFTVLIQTHRPQEEEPAAFTYISIIGCSLSILGLCGIFLTALVLPEWRKGTGKKLQLHFSTAVLLLMCSFLMLAVSGDQQSALCVGTGVLTHFSLLAVYMWTLAIAWYQHRRLTAPLRALDHPPHYLLISALLAWGCPLALCSVLLATDIDTYGPPHCYPYGQTHLMFVYIPVCTIMVANIIIFLHILWSIFECRKCAIHKKSDSQLKNSPLDPHRIKLRLVSSLYLFVLFNVCWVFGFLGWQYVFCLTASLQGISLFIFFVVLNKPTRERWRRKVQLRDLTSS